MSDAARPEIFAAFEPTTPDSEAFWEAADRGELVLTACDACRSTWLAGRLCCPTCGGRRLHRRRASGRATVWSHTTVHIAAYGDRWKSELPYTVLLVTLDEGPRMLSRLAPGHPASEVPIGARVEVVFAQACGRGVPLFRPLPHSTPSTDPPHDARGQEDEHG